MSRPPIAARFWILSLCAIALLLCAVPSTYGRPHSPEACDSSGVPLRPVALATDGVVGTVALWSMLPSGADISPNYPKYLEVGEYEPPCSLLNLLSTIEWSGLPRDFAGSGHFALMAGLVPQILTLPLRC